MITIGDGIPTDACIQANAHALARYAALCQEAGLVPIVEPEVLMDADNTIEACDDVTGRTLRAVFAELYGQDIHLRGTLLKPNMVIAGKGCPTQSPPETVARLTVHNFLRHVPALVPGIVFLSGGQSEVEATENLNAINQIGGPWPLSFSYGRALQASALAAWRGDPANVEAAQEVFAAPRADERARRGGRLERRDRAGRPRVTDAATRTSPGRSGGALGRARRARLGGRRKRPRHARLASRSSATPPRRRWPTTRRRSGSSVAGSTSSSRSPPVAASAT